MVVPDVEEFPGHITCDSRSRRRLSYLWWMQGDLMAVLDVDSDRLDAFGSDDQRGPERPYLVCNDEAMTVTGYPTSSITPFFCKHRSPGARTRLPYLTHPQTLRSFCTTAATRTL